jgi:hypothetical protein
VLQNHLEAKNKKHTSSRLNINDSDILLLSSNKEKLKRSVTDRSAAINESLAEED